MYEHLDIILNTKNNRLGVVKRYIANMEILYWYYPETPHNVHCSIRPTKRFVVVKPFNLLDNVCN